MRKPDRLISIIIVNYNVKYFLEQCLFSVMAALKNSEAEVLVVDNASQDGSREYLENRFPQVRFIWNKENLGFAKANNLALQQAKGDHVLFLNPDTIVPEDCFDLCLRFMQLHPYAGALGVRMIDGRGHFLKESKRAYPSLLTSFFKLAGLAGLFPRSQLFARYHLGHLDPAEDHEVDVLAGAFMWVRKKALADVGGFDERFFMYGEDIDLSYRLQVAGWKNYYFAGTTIIHFKGESTKKGTLNYVRMFYKAMAVFVQKHYTTVTAFFFRFFITLAIWLRAGISAIAGFARRIGLPIFDAINILVSFVVAKYTWNAIVKPEIVYDQGLLSFALPAFTGVFIVAAYYAGLYDKSQKRGRVIHSTVIATIALLVIYSLLPERYRFSRGILLLGSLCAFILLSLSRMMLRKWNVIEAEEEEKLGTVIAGSEKEYERAIAFMQGAEKEQRILGRIGLNNEDAGHLTTITHLPHYLNEVPLREIIFCQGSLSFRDIIHYCSVLPGEIRVRIFSCGAMAIIGSDSSHRSGETLSGDTAYAIGSASSRRLKRSLDILASSLAIIGFPIHIALVKRPMGIVNNAIKVMAGSMTWIGYSSESSYTNGLPVIRKGILGTNGMPPASDPDTEDSLYMLDQMYAREYSVYRDIYLLIKGYKWIGS